MLINPIKYIPIPIYSVKVKPIIRAETIANTEETTEKAPLTLQYQGIISFALSKNILIPIGKGIPRRRPMGDSRIMEIIILIIVEYEIR
jgi:hypothetical protein